MGDSSAEAETYEPNWMARRVGAQSVEQAGQAAAGAAQEAARIEALQQRAVGAQEEASIARLVAEKEAEKERVAVNLAVEAAKMEAALKKARTEAVRLEAERVASADRVAQMEAEVSQCGVCGGGVRAVHSAINAPSGWIDGCKRARTAHTQLAAAPHLT